MSEAYTTLYGEDLVDKLKSDLRGDFEDTTVALMTSPPLYDARLLRGAMKVRFFSVPRMVTTSALRVFARLA